MDLVGWRQQGLFSVLFLFIVSVRMRGFGRLVVDVVIGLLAGGEVGVVECWLRGVGLGVLA
jgi:hypothetical protein